MTEDLRQHPNWVPLPEVNGGFGLYPVRLGPESPVGDPPHRRALADVAAAFGDCDEITLGEFHDRAGYARAQELIFRRYVAVVIVDGAQNVARRVRDPGNAYGVPRRRVSFGPDLTV